MDIPSWYYFRLVSSLHKSLWNENQFVNHVNLLDENLLVQVDLLGEKKVYCNKKLLPCHLSSQSNNLFDFCIFQRTQFVEYIRRN